MDGDRGNIIVDEQSNAVYGMMWGRSEDGPAKVNIYANQGHL